MNKGNAIIAVMAAIIIGAAIFVSLVPTKSTERFGYAPSPAATTTNGSTTVGSVSAALILSANTAALYRVVCEPSTGTLYLWLNSTSTGFTGASGVSVAPGTCLTLTNDLGNLWLGNIYGIMSNGSTTITYHDQ